MPLVIDALSSAQEIESWARRLVGLAALAALVVAVGRMLTASTRPAGRTTGRAGWILRRPVLLVATVLILALGAILWRPLPIALSVPARLLATSVGSALALGGLALYLWGLRTLGRMFGPASGFGVKLHRGHRLVMAGPYAWVRHPMYLGVIVSFVGGLLLYRTWALALYAFMMPGLVLRARREETALAQEFADEWEEYRRRVPGWIPRRRGKRGEH